MKRLLKKLHNRNIWRSLVAYPAAGFVFLQAVDFFSVKYGGNPKLLTYSLIAVIAGFPMAIIWNWRNNSPALKEHYTDNPLMGRQTLAVLPFHNSSEDQSLKYLANGIPENLINRLSSIEDLKVLSRASTFSLDASDRNIHTVSSKLKADIMLTGQLTASGSELIVNCQLTDVHNDSQVWGKKTSCQIRDLLPTENAIVSSLLDQLQVSLQGKANPAHQSDDIHPDAYTQYLKGRYLSYGSTAEEAEKAIAHFREAIKIDPAFGPAYVGIANEKVIQAIFGTATRSDIMGEARTAIQSALALNPKSAEAYMVDGAMKFYGDCDWAGAENSYRKALEMDPNNANTYIRYSAFLASMRRDEEAVEFALKALDLDPISIPSLHNLGWTLMVARQFDESETAFTEALKFHPNWIWGYIKRGYSRVFQGKDAEAMQDAVKAKELMGEWGGEHLEFAYAFINMHAGDEATAREILRNYTAKVNEETYEDPFAVFLYFDLMRETDRALNWAERSWREKSLSSYLFKVGLFISDEIMNHPRYTALLKDMGLN